MRKPKIIFNLAGKSNFIQLMANPKNEVVEGESIKKGVRELIFKYYKFNVWEKKFRVDKDLLQNIIDTFTYAYNRHYTLAELEKEVSWTEISDLRERRLQIKNRDYKPFPVRFGSLKSYLQAEAMDLNMSLHAYVLHLLLQRQKKQQTYLEMYCVPRLNKMYRYKKPFTDMRDKQLALPLNYQV